ncbi:MAG: hypothetical protein IKN26_07695, partial [Eubacterium sp.]|nr:hypothetical protein [Eubacterium sp.]
DSSVAPTCTEAGKNVYKCSVCSASKTETVPATGHTPIEESYAVITAPTCTKSGLAVANCSVCSAAYEETIDPLGHDYVDVETDLTDDGKPGHVLAIPTCTRCGATDKGRVVHKEWIEGYYTTSGTQAAMCETTYSTDTCSIAGCNEVRVHQTEGVGHEYFFVSQSYEGVTLTCRHCMKSVVVSPSLLMEYWEEYKPVNTAPNRTATDNTGYLDLDQNGKINGKDYARIVNLCTKEPILIEEHEALLEALYGRTAVDEGEAALDESKSLTVSEGENHEFTFTPEESGTYTVSSTGMLDTFAFLEISGEEGEPIYNDNGGNLRNFKIEFEAEAGVTYRIITGLTDETAKGTYSVTVSKVEEQTDEGEENEGENSGSGINIPDLPIVIPGING